MQPFLNSLRAPGARLTFGSRLTLAACAAAALSLTLWQPPAVEAGTKAHGKERAKRPSRSARALRAGMPLGKKPAHALTPKVDLLIAFSANGHIGPLQAHGLVKWPTHPRNGPVFKLKNVDPSKAPGHTYFFYSDKFRGYALSKTGKKWSLPKPEASIPRTLKTCQHPLVPTSTPHKGGVHAWAKKKAKTCRDIKRKSAKEKATVKRAASAAGLSQSQLDPGGYVIEVITLDASGYRVYTHAGTVLVEADGSGGLTEYWFLNRFYMPPDGEHAVMTRFVNTPGPGETFWNVDQLWEAHDPEGTLEIITW